MGHDFLGAVIGEGEAGAAVLHHLLGALHDGGEGVDRDVHGQRKVAARSVHITAAQFVLIGESDGMHDEIEAVPTLCQARKQRIYRRLVAHIAGQHDIRAE